MKTITVAKYTFLEVLRSRIFIGLFILAVIISIVSYIAAEFAYGAPAKVSLDFGIGLMSISNIVIAIFLGVTLISKEIDTKTLYMILSRPISRVSFLFGKFLGLATVVVLNTLLLVSVSLFLFTMLGGKFSNLILWVSFFSILESLIIMGIAIMFSLITSNALSVFFTIVYLIAAHSIGETLNIFFAKTNAVITFILKVFSVFVIDLERINYKDFLIYSSTVPGTNLYYSIAYAVSYLVVIFLLISFIFDNKNLD